MPSLGRVSVVTPVYRSRRWLPGYFKALAALDTGGAPLEVVLVDNDPRHMCLEEYLALAGGLEVRVLTNDRNEGFGRASNRGVREARGDTVLFLNVDTEVEPGALSLLQRRLERDPGCAIAEARQAPVPHPKLTWPGTGRVDWCSACCMLMRRDLFLEVGGFDEVFFLYGEDVDLSFRLRDRGFRLAYVPEAVCVHHDGQKTLDERVVRAHHLVRSGLLVRARWDGLRGYLVGWWQEFMRTVRRRQGPELWAALGALRRAPLDAIPLIMERWGRRRGDPRRIFPDDGSFGTHGKHPEEAASASSSSASPPPSLPSPSPIPSFSVLVPTEGRDPNLEPLVEALLFQMETLGQGELVLVDHGARVGVADGLAERFGGTGRLKVVDHPGGNAAEARNAGLRAARGDFVVFLDDDVLPGLGLLAGHLARLALGDAVVGPIVDTFPVGGNPFRRWLRDVLGREDGAPVPEGEAWRLLATANASVRRARLDELARPVGPFDRELADDDAADLELALGLSRASVLPTMAPELAVLRRTVPSLRGFLAARFRSGYAAAQLVEREGPSARIGASPGDPPTPGDVAFRAVAQALATPLAAPAFVLDALSPASWRTTPVTALWMASAGAVARDAGFLWRRAVGRRPS